jgi:hypothetical protein
MLRLLFCTVFGAANGVNGVLLGIGVTWGSWLGLNQTQSQKFNDLSMKQIRAAGATVTGLSFNWGSVEETPGVYNWSDIDSQVSLAESNGLIGFAYTGLTPDWALDPKVGSL